MTFASYVINDPYILISVKYIINILLNSLTLPTSEKSTVRSLYLSFFFFPERQELRVLKGRQLHRLLTSFLFLIARYILDLRITLVTQMLKNLPTMQETQVQSLGWQSSWRRK